MKITVPIIIFVFIVAGGRSEFNIQNINKDVTPVATMKALASLIKAGGRKDYVWVLVQAIEVFKSLHPAVPDIFILSADLIELGLIKIHPAYLKLYPDKRPPNVTIHENIFSALTGSMSGNAYLQTASSAFSKVETPLFQGVIKALF